MGAPNPLFSLSELEAAAQLVHRTVPPTPQYAWPLLAKRTGCEVWVKHENHTPTSAFKVRGGIVYMDNLKRSSTKVTGVVSATRGNHGQSIAFSASRAGISATIYVPLGNSTDQNAAMRAFGATVVEFGRDFDETLAECHRVAREQSLHFIAPFNRDQVKGVATYALELFRAVADLSPQRPGNGPLVRGREAGFDRLGANLCRRSGNTRPAPGGRGHHQAGRSPSTAAWRGRHR